MNTHEQRTKSWKSYHTNRYIRNKKTREFSFLFFFFFFFFISWCLFLFCNCEVPVHFEIVVCSPVTLLERGRTKERKSIPCNPTMGAQKRRKQTNKMFYIYMRTIHSFLLLNSDMAFSRNIRSHFQTCVSFIHFLVNVSHQVETKKKTEILS